MIQTEAKSQCLVTVVKGWLRPCPLPWTQGCVTNSSLSDWEATVMLPALVFLISAACPFILHTDRTEAFEDKLKNSKDYLKKIIYYSRHHITMCY